MSPISDTPTRPTLRTLAQVTGLGVSTVSQALRDSPEIAEETKERVRLAAQQAGYRPNRAGVRLRTGKTNVIALVMNTQEEIMGLTSYMIAGISERLRATPYHLVVTPYSRANDPLEPIRYIVETGSADGIIFSATQRDDPRVHYLAEHNFPFASHGRTKMGVEHPFHDFDNDAFAFEAVTALAARGRRRIALVAPPPIFTYHDHMVEGFQRAIAQHSLVAVPFTDANVDSTLREVRDAVGRLLGSRVRPEAIVCGSGAVTFGVVAACEDAGLKIGRDIDLASKQYIDLLQWVRPEIIAFHEDIVLAGTALASAVIGGIEGRAVAELQSVSFPTAYGARQTEKSEPLAFASSRTA
jgi:LacI family transcriptional regulator